MCKLDVAFCSSSIRLFLVQKLDELLAEEKRGVRTMRLRFDLPPLEYERQMHRYWYGKFRIAMFIIGLLGMPYVAGVIALIIRAVGQ